MVLPGVKISNNVIIGAGSVVTKSIDESETVWARNPAKLICTFDDVREKYKDYNLNTWYMTFEKKKKYLLENESKFKKV